MKILISQHIPSNLAPYEILQSRFGAELAFHPFFLIEPLSAKEFRAEHINLPDYTAIIFSSRHAIDAYFKLCEEMRFKVPETMKYFCSTDAVAMYLQKHIVYRKRKIFYGAGTVASMVQAIGAKHRNENFLIACTDNLKPDVHKLFTKEKLKHGSAVFVRTVSNDLHDIDLHGYQIVAFYSPADVKSLQESYPAFKQDDLIFATYGPSTARAAEEAGLKVEIKAPLPGAPSITEALNNYLEAGKAKE